MKHNTFKLLWLAVAMVLLNGCRLMNTPIGPPSFLNDGFKTGYYGISKRVGVAELARHERYNGYVYVDIPQGYRLICGNSAEELKKNPKCRNSSTMIVYYHRNIRFASQGREVYLDQLPLTEGHQVAIPIPFFKKLRPKYIRVGIRVVSVNDPNDQLIINGREGRANPSLRMREYSMAEIAQAQAVPEPATTTVTKEQLPDGRVRTSCSCPGDAYQLRMVPQLTCSVKFLCIEH